MIVENVFIMLRSVWTAGPLCVWQSTEFLWYLFQQNCQLLDLASGLSENPPGHAREHTLCLPPEGQRTYTGFLAAAFHGLVRRRRSLRQGIRVPARQPY